MFSIDDFNSLIQHTPLKKTITKPLKVANPIYDSKNTLTKDVFEKTTEIKEFIISHICPHSNTKQALKVVQNSQDKGILYRKVLNKETGKIEKIPFEANIAKSKDKWTVTYHFLEPETKEEIGFVSIDDWRLAKGDPIYDFLIENSRLIDDFPELGITGDRISINYLQNNNEQLYSGIGNLGDQIAIEYCLKEGITPNIISAADLNSHAAHYKRGRRFFQIAKSDKDIDYYEFKKVYGTDDPNKIVEERIKETPKGQKVDTSDLCEIYMYMPQDVVERYLRMIKEHPVLH
ncbi:MAG: hypothetical protein KHX03_10265 [Clostridium sp.]|nr:hypothetical protein [Clostridium sp.]